MYLVGCRSTSAANDLASERQVSTGILGMLTLRSQHNRTFTATTKYLHEGMPCLHPESLRLVLPCTTAGIFFASKHLRPAQPSMLQGCNSISLCVVGPGAAVVNCGLVSCSHPATETSSGSRFANGLSVAVGPETRGRELACYATMSLAEAAAAAVDRTSPEAVKEHRMAVDEYAELARYARAGQKPTQRLVARLFFCDHDGVKERRGRFFGVVAQEGIYQLTALPGSRW